MRVKQRERPSNRESVCIHCRRSSEAKKKQENRPENFLVIYLTISWVIYLQEAWLLVFFLFNSNYHLPTHVALLRKALQLERADLINLGISQGGSLKLSSNMSSC